MQDTLGLGAVADGASKAVIKLLDVLQVGLGGIFAPWQRVRMAKAESESMRLLAGGRIEVAVIEQQGQASLNKLREQALDISASIVPVESGAEPSAPRLTERSFKRFEYQEAKRQLNLETISAHTFNRLIDSDASEEPVDPDWVARYFENAKDVSDSEMQRLWASLLAGEIVQPGKFSLRTLDTLRNMTTSEAKALIEIGACSTKDGTFYLPDDKAQDVNVRDALTLPANSLANLVEAGLLHPGHRNVWPRHNEELVILEYPGYRVSFSFSEDAKVWGLSLYRLTQAARDLLGIQDGSFNREFLDRFTKCATLLGYGAEVETAP